VLARVRLGGIALVVHAPLSYSHLYSTKPITSLARYPCLGITAGQRQLHRDEHTGQKKLRKVHVCRERPLSEVGQCTIRRDESLNFVTLAM